MEGSNQVIRMTDARIAWAEVDGLLGQGNDLGQRPREELAPSETNQCGEQIAVRRERRLVFGDGLLVSAMSSQQLSSDEMRQCRTGRCRQGLAGQLFCADEVLPGEV